MWKNYFSLSRFLLLYLLLQLQLDTPPLSLEDYRTMEFHHFFVLFEQ